MRRSPPNFIIFIGSLTARQQRGRQHGDRTTRLTWPTDWHESESRIRRDWQRLARLEFSDRLPRIVSPALTGCWKHRKDCETDIDISDFLILHLNLDSFNFKLEKLYYLYQKKVREAEIPEKSGSISQTGNSVSKWYASLSARLPRNLDYRRNYKHCEPVVCQ